MDLSQAFDLTVSPALTGLPRGTSPETQELRRLAARRTLHDIKLEPESRTFIVDFLSKHDGVLGEIGTKSWVHNILKGYHEQCWVTYGKQPYMMKRTKPNNDDGGHTTPENGARGGDEENMPKAENTTKGWWRSHRIKQTAFEKPKKITKTKKGSKQGSILGGILFFVVFCFFLGGVT